MPFRTVTFVPGFFYHIYNRGSEKRTIFLTKGDYNNFLDRVKEGLKKYSISLQAFCLLPNHFHFLLKQTNNISIAVFMNSLSVGHAKYFNTKYERVGPLFQGRFKAKLIETDEYLLQLSKYIHRNPLPEKITNYLNYPYSSYQNYLGNKIWPFIKTETILSYFSKNNPQISYKNFVEETDVDLETLARLILEE